jgi:hypothetical protein
VDLDSGPHLTAPSSLEARESFSSVVSVRTCNTTALPPDRPNLDSSSACTLLVTEANISDTYPCYVHGLQNLFLPSAADAEQLPVCLRFGEFVLFNGAHAGFAFVWLVRHLCCTMCVTLAVPCMLHYRLDTYSQLYAATSTSEVFVVQQFRAIHGRMPVSQMWIPRHGSRTPAVFLQVPRHGSLLRLWLQQSFFVAL